MIVDFETTAQLVLFALAFGIMYLCFVHDTL